jgi:hypothetical protein
MPLNAVRLAIQEDDKSAMLPFEVDFYDYIDRRNPHAAAPVATRRRLFTRRVQIRSEFLLVGPTRVHAGLGKPVATEEIARALR